MSVALGRLFRVAFAGTRDATVMACMLLTAVDADRRSRVGAANRRDNAPIYAIPLAWLSVALVLAWDPFGAFEWIMD